MQKMLEVSKDGDGNHGIELSLELSIGGCYEGSENAAKQAADVVAESEKLHDENNNVSDVSEAFVGHAKEESGSEVMDQQRKRDFHALRRQEARRKKAEKQKRSIQSKGMNGNEKAYLEAQKFQARVQDREKRENEKIEEFSHKSYNNNKEKNTNADHRQDLNDSLNQAEKLSCQKSRMMSTMQVQHGAYMNGFGYPCGVPFWGQSVGKEKDDEKNVKNLFQPVASRSFRPYQNGYGSSDLSHISSVGCDSERNGGKCGVGNQRAVSNGSLERTSSAFSDYQSTSQKGGSCSTDTGSHSNYSEGCQQQLSASATSDTFERSEMNGPSSQMDSDKADGKTANINVKLVSTNSPAPERTDPQKSDLIKNPTSMPQEPTSSSSKGSNEVTTKPPKPQTHDQGTTRLRQMPFVSTTGNGPNGKTINGFLYRYTKTEVSIVCVCHGNSFSPAEFVEHAGGIDISHPLRHITIVPTSFG